MGRAEAASAPDEPYEDLGAAAAGLWARLRDAARDRRSAWHIATLATVGSDGAPQLRVLVLRAAEEATGLLRLHTDARSAKVAEIARAPQVQLLFYDKGAGLQLRLSGTARVETAGQQADAAWAAANLFARRCYTAPLGPGAASEAPTSGLPAELEGREPTLAESMVGRANFAVLLVEARRLEFLHLAVTGHRRGWLEQGEDGWQGGWLVP